MKLHSAVESRRTAIDLRLAFAIAFVVLLLNVFANMSEHVAAVFRGYTRIPAAGILVNGLFFWLFLLLWVAFRRWRQSTRQRMELEDVISSISPDALLVVRPDRTIGMCNASLRRILGYAPEEVLNRKTDLLYHDRRTRKDNPREVHDALEKDGFHTGTATGRRKDGQTVPLEIISSELSGHAGAVLLLRDITERLRREDERRRLEAQIQQAQRLESLGVLAGGIAHDFMNLVGIIQGHADLVLASERARDDTQKSVAEIAKATERATALCEHLLSFAGEEPAALGPLDLAAIAEETLRLMSVSIPAGVRLETQLRRGVPPIHGDAAQVQQIVMNLVKNAIDSLSGDGSAGAVSVQTELLECGADFLGQSATSKHLEPGRYACLRVIDAGCGMDERTRQRVFEPFFTTKVDGHGMGLAAVLGLVRGHHGGIRVESAPGKGSTFSVLFPV